jgi:tripeptide aminopeptidase
MREQVEPYIHIVDLAKQAMEQAGVKPLVHPIRGGTDGSRLSYMGLPCPNIFAGGHNFHGKYEFVPLQAMGKAVEVILNIVKLYAAGKH